ncbi:hypothetical protein K5713_00440 [Trueperella pyogenes]|uniref:hypothetical protein n=1 Tax=Trueperella pyogenes TaxID=1661 RepID=UPI00216AA831|nr:hypothetical protein [Trueperella pyogenes]UVJ53834.1 hypothetical protein K5713_00440 [Trueperella pyogenes]
MKAPVIDPDSSHAIAKSNEAVHKPDSILFNHRVTSRRDPMVTLGISKIDPVFTPRDLSRIHTRMVDEVIGAVAAN